VIQRATKVLLKVMDARIGGELFGGGLFERPLVLLAFLMPD
jgi:hypothetical protein